MFVKARLGTNFFNLIVDIYYLCLILKLLTDLQYTIYYSYKKIYQRIAVMITMSRC